MSEEIKHSVALPGEWALQKAFGPVLGELGEDMKKLYALGRDKILVAGYKKIINKDDGKKANLRVTRDVFWNGSFSDESICAEYFGGILASARSEDGKDDSGVYYVDLIKSLSSKQLILHYAIYSSLNKLLISNPEKKKLNSGQESELQHEKIVLSTNEILKIVNNKDFGRDLHALHAKGVIGNFKTGFHSLKDGKEIPKIEVSPKPLGIQLYSVAHNKLEEWRDFASVNFKDFENIESPKFYGHNITELLERAGIKDTTAEIKSI